jgi:large subunit ribosomal protein L21
VPKPDGSLTAVVVSGGKQFRVAAGDRIVVDRLAAEPGAELTLSKVLMVAEGEDLKVAPGDLQAVSVLARVLGHQRGPKLDVLRYKSKKRVRVHRGARADLTALEILEIGGKGRAKPEPKEEAVTKKGRRARARTAEPAAAAAESEPEAAPAPKRARARKAKAEEGDGS